jgi:hypothetical protein
MQPRQGLAIAQFDKATLVAKLKAARDRSASVPASVGVADRTSRRGPT